MKKIFYLDCLMVAYSFMMASYYGVLALVAAPAVTITGLPNWRIFQTSMSPVFYLIAAFTWLLSFAIWELMALRDYDKLKKQKNPRVA